MRIQHLSLTNFRNYSRLELDLPAGVVLLQGDNAQGKTNLLEAIYLLSRMRSPRTSTERELVNWLALEEDLPFARLVAQIEKGAETEPLATRETSPLTTLETSQLELSLVQNHTQGLEANGAALRKTIRVNGVNKRALDAVGLLNAVLFMPQDIDLVAGSPSGRRRYLDDTICQIDGRYCRELQSYNRVLTERNHLLKSLRGRSPPTPPTLPRAQGVVTGTRGAVASNSGLEAVVSNSGLETVAATRDGVPAYDPAELAFWDQHLVEHGAYLTTRRQQVIQQLDEAVQRIHLRLTGEQERLRLEYDASVRRETRPGAAYQMAMAMEAETLPASQTEVLPDVAASFAAQLRELRSKEVELGMSLLGPHRDELRFWVNGVDMNIYGSRGQQRTTALSLKLAEMEWLTQEKQDKPVLLLDDVISELDAPHRGQLLAAIDQAQQVIITTTDLAHYSQEFLSAVTLWRVSAGRIEGCQRASNG
jgi:DNA replication and repair protein RecF